MSRTRIKICGLTREDDLRAALTAGADAIGFVFYRASPRYVAPKRAASLAELIPPFVTRVGLFVNPAPLEVEEVLAAVPLDLLQFHGDESDSDCRQFGRPFIKAARMSPGLDLLEFARAFPGARALLLDAYAEGYGGSGQTFDWAVVPRQLPCPIILSGGLRPDNVKEGITRLHPWAVDVSSGVESAKGIKDVAKIAAFVAAVKDADAG